jgi:DGQHR domain-containing protein
MLHNVDIVDNLRGLARAKSRNYETKTVHPNLVSEYTEKGWTVTKEQLRSVKLTRKKTHSDYLEDRVWSLLYRMGFTHLSGERGAKLLLNPKEPDGPKQQIDVVGFDEDVALAVECKSAETYGKRPQFQEELGKIALIRERFSNTINTQYTAEHKREVVLAMFLSNISLSDNDLEKARQAKVVIFDDQDLKYYESLVSQLGPAAKYQFFSDMLPNKEVPGLRIRVPAVRTKMGGTNCYSFCISPEYLLKISFVSHRAKGKASDVDTYQRMIRKSRLVKIREYITDDGIFPTNIVINLEKKHLQFERAHQETDDYVSLGSGTLGWLEIRPTYKSAWVIDGQHRLFAYSGHPNASASLLSVLAFEGLLPSKQAKLFIDINAEQKKVKKSLLNELYAKLHWDAEEPAIVVRAIVSRSVQELDEDPGSPFYRRIQTSDEAKSPTQCVSLSGLYGAIEKKGFHIVKEKHGHVVEYGPLWAGDREETLKRTTFILNGWFNLIRSGAPDWWDKGSAEGGGLSMNDSVVACINVLRSVLDHLDAGGAKLIHLDNDDLLQCISRYGEALGEYFGSLNGEERRQYRSLRAIQGQTTRTRRCQEGIRTRIPDFNPTGLDDWLTLQKAETNRRAKEITDRLEVMLKNLIVEDLRREFGPDESQWWLLGIPKTVRLKVTQRYEDDDGKRGDKESYFDLLDYRKIATSHWDLFRPLLSYGNKSAKDAGTQWLEFVNEQRNLVAHPSSGAAVPLDVLDQLQAYEEWLNSQSKKTSSESQLEDTTNPSIEPVGSEESDSNHV